MGGITVDYTGFSAHLICCKWKKNVKSEKKNRKGTQEDRKKRCEKEDCERKHRKGEEQ